MAVTKRLMRGRDNARRLTLAVAYVYAFFLLTPRFEAVTHVHDGDHAGHQHKMLRSHDVALERAALVTAGQGRPSSGLARTAPAPRGDAAIPDEPHGGARLTESEHAAHTHFREDPNLAGIGAPGFPPAGKVARSDHAATVPDFVPALKLLASPARAPPRG